MSESNRLNEYAISSEGIGEGLKRSAASLVAAGNTIDQAVALVTAANLVVQDPATVGNALKTVAMRVRGARVELEAAGEDVDGMVESTAKLREQLLALTSGKVDIMLDENTFKSTYQIMLEMSKVWDSMTDINRASALELIAGKRQGNVISSMLANAEQMESVLQDSVNSAGSAMEEHAKILDSVGGRMETFRATAQDLSRNTIDSEFVKVIIRLGTAILEIINKIGLWNVALVALAGILGTKTTLAITTGAQALLTRLIPALGATTAGATTLSMALSTMIPVAVIIAGIAAFDYLSKALERQQEKVAELTAKYEDISSQIDALNEKKFSAFDTPLTENEQARLDYLEKYKETLEDSIAVANTLEAALKFYGEGDWNPFTKGEFGDKSTDIRQRANLASESWLNASSGVLNNPEEVQRGFKGLTDYFDQLTDKSESLRQTLEKPLNAEMTKRLKADLEDTDASIDQVVKALEFLKTTGFIDFTIDTSDLDEAAKSTDNYADSITALSAALDSFLDKEKLVSSVQNEVKESHKISFDNIQKLLKAYPELESVLHDYLAGLASTSDVMTAVNEAYDTDLKNYKDAIIEKQKLDDTFYSNTLSQSAKKVNAFNDQYGVDLSNYKNLAEAKLEVEKILIGDLARLWSQYYDSTSGAFNQQYDDLVERAAMGSRVAGVRVAKLDKIMSQRDAMISALDEIAYGGIDVSLGKAGKSSSSSSGKAGKSSSSSSSKSTDPIIQAFENAYKELRYQLDKSLINEEQFYKFVEALNNKYYKGKSKYLDEYRKYEIEVLKGLEKYYEEYYQTQLKLAKEALEARQKSLNEEKTAYEGALAAVVSRIDKEIDSLNKEKEALQETNDEKERAIKLEQLRENLARAKEQRTKRVFMEGIGFVWVADQTAISDAEKAIDDFEADENIREIDKQIKKWEEYKKKWQDTVKSYNNKQNELYATQVLGAKWESNILDQRTNRLEAFRDDYIRIMEEIASVEANIANIEQSTPSGKTVKAGKDGNAPTGTKVGDIVQTQGGTYKVVSPGTAGAGYNPATGLYSVKIDDKRTYATGGIADYTGIAKLDGSPSAVETIFNAKQGKKLYDFINNVPDMTQFVVGKLMKSFSSVPLKSSATGVVNLSVGDIYLNGVQDTNSLSKAIVQKLPNQILQDLFKK
ncbi:MAG TPA: hypothetical protein VFD00_08135 [Thermoclostridium sp.]|nr:hypothetical protein [Thermoclostridium sp.]